MGLNGGIGSMAAGVGAPQANQLLAFNNMAMIGMAAAGNAGRASSMAGSGLNATGNLRQSPQDALAQLQRAHAGALTSLSNHGNGVTNAALLANN